MAKKISKKVAKKNTAKKAVVKSTKKIAKPTIKKVIKKAPEKTKNKPTVKKSLPHITSIVGIGASAGGLETIKSLITSIPNDTGLGFVVIQHLSEDYPSQAEQIYGSSSTMEVHVGEDGMKVKPNQIYFIPHDADLIVKNGFLKLIPRLKATASSLHLPINQFFNSLAQDRGANSVGIILSGTGSDGAEGMKALSKAGGTTIIQDPATALYSQMPQASLDQMTADYVLPVEKIADELIKISQRSGKNKSIKVSEKTKSGSQDEEQTNFELIVDKVRTEHGIDFADYKFSTLKRRFKRRMDFCKAHTFKDYLGYIEKNPTELHDLYEDLTINVTQFFRNPEIFDYLKSEIMSKLVEGHDHENPIRIWVPGCSTGEEAYSLAIILSEIMEKKKSKIPFQIFATDISETVLEKGRKGIYSNEIKTDVSPERLEKFFSKINNHYQINKTIRDCCLFARHDVTHDPPFSRIDLISCRNLLIYLNPSLQKRVIDIFSFALNLNGLLVLGNSENITSTHDVLRCISKKCKIHIKVSNSLKLPPQTTPFRSKFIKPNSPRIQNPTATLAFDFKAEMDRVYSERFGHSGLLINERMEIIQIYGNISPFLEFTPGEATFNISKIISKDLLFELRSILLTVKKTKKASVKKGVQFKEKNKTKTLNIDVVPIIGPDHTTYYSVFFTDISIAAEAIGPISLTDLVGKSLKTSQKSSKDDMDAKKQASILALELDETKKIIQTIIEEQDVTNDELQIVNEELMSSNEELQSSNEELQTAQEELQSTNEELRTLNEELNYRNIELDSLSGDLTNILTSVATPILIIGGDYVIRRFTPAAQELFNVIPGDIGRSFTNIKHNLKGENLEALISETINKNSPIEKDIQDTKDRWYSLKIRPYTTPDNRIDGVVCVLIDINDAKTASEKIELERNIAEAIVESVENPLLILDENLNVKSANDAFFNTFKVKSKETLGHKLYDIGNRQWDIPKLREFIEKMTSSSQKFTNFNVTHTFANIGQKVLQLRGGQVIRKDKTGNDIFLKIYLLSIEDITNQVRNLDIEKSARKVAEKDQTRSESALKDAEAVSKDLVDEKNIRLKFISSLSHDLLTPLTVARLNSEILAKKVKHNEVLQKTSTTITRNIDRVVDMLSNLLSVNRIEAGQDIFLKIEKCNLTAIVSRSIEALSAIHGDRFIFNNPRPIEGFWDASALQRVVDNLCSNAVKYGNDQPVSINLFSQERYIQLTVHNEGKPISIKDQATLFDLFHRSSDAVHSGKVGWGIGLTYVDDVVHAHKGTIQIQSAEDFGTSFIITLPKDPLNY